MIQLKSTHAINANTFGAKALVYAGAKIGKTRLCYTAPAPVIISSENGLLSLKRMPNPLPYIEVNNTQQLMDAYTWIFQSREAQQFATFCFDGITNIADVLLEDHRKKTKDPRKAYQDTYLDVVNILDGLRKLNRHVYITAEEDYDKDQFGALMYRPNMPSKALGSKLPYIFDVIMRLQVFTDKEGNPFRALRTRADNVSVAGDRSGILDEWEPADLGHVFNKLLNG